jgi:polysaccharide biosynthesis protein PslG
VPRSFYGTVAATPLTQSDFDRMGDARVGSLRLGVYWPTVQPEHRGPLNWGGIDQAVAAAGREHILVLPILYGTPAYEANGCTRHSCSAHIRFKTKAQRRDWQAFVTAAVRRYGPNGDFWSANPGVPYEPITRWQIWNEQNNPGQRNPAGRYATLLKSADRTIHAVDPRAQTVLGGMLGTPRGGRRRTAWNYLGRLYKAGAGQHFDAAALHPYSRAIPRIRTQIKRMRRVLRHHHDGDRQILITEIGWGSSRKRHPGTNARGAVFNVNPKQQRRNLARSFDLLTNNRRSWRIGGVYWFQWKDPKDPPPGLCAFCYSAGLYRADGETAKPALSAYERFTRKTRG